MALYGSLIVIVFIGVAAYAAAGPVQAGPNTLQQNEYGELADLLARYREDRRMNPGAKRNLDQRGGGHLVRDTDKHVKDLLNEEEKNLIRYLNSANNQHILDTIRQDGFFAKRFRNGNLINSSINSVAPADIISYPYSLDLNAGQANDQLFMEQLGDFDVPKNAREDNRRIVKNLDQIGGGNLVRTLNQIDKEYLVRNLDQIGGGHLMVRNLDQIGGGNLVRSVDYPTAETKRRSVEELANILAEKQYLKRNLDQIGGGNLVRNLDQIGGGNLVRSFN